MSTLTKFNPGSLGLGVNYFKGRDVPPITPMLIESYIYAMGNPHLHNILGATYLEVNRVLRQKGYSSYTLSFEKWRKPGPLDFVYTPDLYEWLNIGYDACEYQSPFKILLEDQAHIIDVSGGYGKYLSRLKAKKRSEIKKLGSRVVFKENEWISLPCCYTSSKRTHDAIDLICLKLLDEHKEGCANKSIDEWFEDGFDTIQSPLSYLLYLSKYDLDINPENENRFTRFLLPLYDKDTDERVAISLGVIDHKTGVAHFLYDIAKSESYTCKEASLANIQWACEHYGESVMYVDFSNEVMDESDESMTVVNRRVRYKNLFYTGKANLPFYFPSKEVMDMYLDGDTDEES